MFNIYKIINKPKILTFYTNLITLQNFYSIPYKYLLIRRKQV